MKGLGICFHSSYFAWFHRVERGIDPGEHGLAIKGIADLVDVFLERAQYCDLSALMIQSSGLIVSPLSSSRKYFTRLATTGRTTVDLNRATETDRTCICSLTLSFDLPSGLTAWTSVHTLCSFVCLVVAKLFGSSSLSSSPSSPHRRCARAPINDDPLPTLAPAHGGMAIAPGRYPGRW